MAARGDNTLIIGPSWVGDMVMAQALFISLKQQHPPPRITVLAPAWSRPLLDCMPEVDASLPSPFEHGQLKLGERRRMGKSLRRQNFTRAIVLPNSFKSALIPFHAGIPERTGWRGEWRQLLLTDCRKLDQRALPRMVDRFVSLGCPPGHQLPDPVPVPALQVDAADVQQTLQRLQLAVPPAVIAVCAGAEFGAAKQWPAQHFAELVNHLAGNGWQLWLLGSARDQLVTESILADVEARYLPRCVNLAGSTSLTEAINLLSCVSAVVANDSGLLHVAAALNKPVVGIYGASSPEFTPPLTKRVELLATDIACRPCFQRQCPYGHRRCLTELQPAVVTEAVEQLIVPARVDAAGNRG